MPTRIDPRGEDNLSTYIIQDTGSNIEMIRLLFLYKLVIYDMGGPLAEQADPASLHYVLDVACGPGVWVLEAARLYPHMELVGIDISWRMIEYARVQAQASRLTDGVEFRVMDALAPLKFPDASFDLVNIHLASTFVTLSAWPKLLQELVRVTRPGGIIRLMECGTPQTSSPAHNKIWQMQQRAGYQTGYCLTAEQWGVLPVLPQLLRESGCHNVQSRPHVIACPAGTLAGETFYQIMLYHFQTVLPFLQTTGCITEDYETLYQQALLELQLPRAHVQWSYLTVWGTTPAEDIVSFSKGGGRNTKEESRRRLKIVR
jgi:ubiquinone/menaquinone biosynthesis C-methylase UbiE